MAATPITPIRLNFHDKAMLMATAAHMQSNASQAMRFAIQALGRFAVNADVRDALACRLGEGHTAHIWEHQGVNRFCAGQPFSNGYDPIDDEVTKERLRSLAFISKGLRGCCGATNLPCDDAKPVMTPTGCERCGHPQGCHYDAGSLT